MSISVVVGNLRPGSRTLAAAVGVATRLAGRAPDHVLDVIELRDELFTGGPGVQAAVATVASSDQVVVASPTFKGAPSGVLKLFLDHVDSGGWDGVTAYPLMVGGRPDHALAPEVFLRPILTELGASCPTRGLYLPETDPLEASVLEPWLAIARRYVPVATA